jgi:MFS family permease
LFAAQRGLGTNFGLLLAGRMLQATCAGIMTPMSMTILLLIFPHEKRGSAMGMYSFAIMFAPAVGPAISGVLTDKIGWRVMFLIMAALAAVILVMFANTPINIWSVGKLSDNSLNHGNAVLSTLRQTASTLGIAMMVSVMSLVTSISSKQDEIQSRLTGMSAAYWLAFWIAIICLILVAVRVYDRENWKSPSQDLELDAD